MFLVSGQGEEKIWYRFRKDYTSTWYVDNNQWDAIDFRVNKTIELIGFVTFGPTSRVDCGVTYKYGIDDNFSEEEKTEQGANDPQPWGENYTF